MMGVKGQDIKKIMVTGVAGFIGSNSIRHIHDHFPDIELVNYDKLTYAGNLGVDQERSNNDVTRQILRHLGKPESLIRAVADRKGHDFRYALDWGKIRGLGWQPLTGFTEGLSRTIEWYLGHRDWWRKLIKKKIFQSHLRKNYE